MKEFYIVSGVAAKGGDWGAMTPRDWGRIGGHLRWSYATLGNFANDIYDFLEKEGRFPGNLEMRADHYRGRAKAIFHKTLAVVQRWPDLPAYPGDGSTQCFFWSDKVRVFTLQGGFIRLASVEKGMQVLTGKGRWRKVIGLTEIPVKNFSAIALELQFSERKDSRIRVCVSPDHLFLNESLEWVQAKDLKVGDKLSRIVKRCEREGCLNPVALSRNGSLRFCSRSCSKRAKKISSQAKVKEYRKSADVEVISKGFVKKTGTLKCLQVEEDNSFVITRGLISHNCLSNCLCSWRVERTPEAFNCYWTLGLGEHCQDCLDRSRIWDPLVVPFEPPEVEFPPGTPIPPDEEEGFLRFLKGRIEDFFAKEGRTTACQRLERFLDRTAWDKRRKGAAAVHNWDSFIELSPDTWDDFRALWARGEVRDWFDAVALKTLLHEFLHTINPIKPSDYSVPIFKAFEEATTEEAAHKLWRDFAQFLGLSIDPKLVRVGAFYKKWRDEFKELIWRASRYHLKPEEVMLTLKYSVPPSERVLFVSKLFEENYPEASRAEVSAFWLATYRFDGLEFIKSFIKRKGIVL